jgi:sugar/nucleoside kinase (ribokinase family)
LGIVDVNSDTVGNPDVILIEGYVWDIAEGPELAAEAIRLAKDTDSKVALSLSDSHCVERHRDAFHAAVRDGVDIVMADEDEINALLQTDNFEETSRRLADYDNLFAITRSEKGSVIMHGEQKIVQPASTVESIVDTTGAGDAYTAGFLFGYTQKKSLEECAKIGTFCATHVIQQVGARIEQGLLDSHVS